MEPPYIEGSSEGCRTAYLIRGFSIQTDYPELMHPGHQDAWVKGPFLMAEQFRLDQFRWNGTTIDGHKRLVPAGTGVMDGAGESLIPRRAISSLPDIHFLE